MIQTVAPFDSEMIKKQNAYYRLKFNLLKILTTLSVAKARNVIFITNKAREELSHCYKFPERKTSVIYHGRSTLFRPALDYNRLQEIKKIWIDRYSLSLIYINIKIFWN